MLDRVLVIINTIDAGGAEGFVMKVFRCLNKEKFVFDFLINVPNSNFYREEIYSLGGNIYYGYPKSKNPIKSFNCIKKTVEKRKYKTVFCVAVHPLGFLDLWASKLGGADIRVMRSANSNTAGVISRILAILTRPLVRKFATAMVTPSSEAGVFMYGKKALLNNQVSIVPNGIDPGIFLFNEESRMEIRKEFSIRNDTIVVGHIGRFNTQKNHDYLIEVFSQYKSLNSNAVLLLVGRGELEDDVRQKAMSSGINEDVIFAGVRNDVPKLLMGMDILVMPSLYEGMPNVVIEAQAAGLKCLISDRITKEAKITDLVTYKDISVPPAEWALEIESILARKVKERDIYNSDVVSQGYAIDNSARLLEDMFEGSAEK